MTDQQRAAHQRMISTLPLRNCGDMDAPENWPESDRPLSPAEVAYADADSVGRP